MLARRLGAAWRVPVRAHALRRDRWTAPQTQLSGSERRRNVRGAFSYSGPPLAGKRVLLVDDVYTSGSTVNECARVLKRSGAPEVDVVTLARTRQESLG